MYRFLSSISTRRPLFFGLIVLSFGMFILMQVLFSTQFAHLNWMGSPSAPPDSRLYYTPDQLADFLESLGPAGRLVYLRLHLVDMIFPIVYGLFFAVVTVYFWGVRGGLVKTATSLAVLPIAGAMSDCAENVCIQIVSAGAHPVAALIAGYATAVKWGLTAASVLAIAAGIIVFIVRGRSRGARFDDAGGT
jgi:hypothetical protein